MTMILGTNVGPVEYFRPNLPYLNVFKQSAGWSTRNAGANSGQESILYPNLDGDGYPTTLAGLTAGSSVRVGFVQSIPSPYYPSGSYTVLFDGAGTIAISGDGSLSTSTSGSTFTAAPSGTGLFFEITATDPLSTGNYIRNVRVVETQYVSLLNGGEIFHPTFITRMTTLNPKLLRFMDANATIINTEANWSDRRPYTYMSWGANTMQPSGVFNSMPYEVQIALCNKLNADGWFNIPLNATDSFITSMATLVHSTLNPSLKAYVEFYNETWQFLGGGTSSPPGSTFVASARAQTPDIVPGGSDGQYAWLYAIIRKCKAADLWNTAFGADSARCIPALASQLGYTSRSQDEMNYTNASYFTGTAASHHKAYAGAPYFGDGVPVALAWTADADGGLTKAFQEIQTGGLLPNSSATAHTTAGTSTAFTVTTGASLPSTPANGTIIRITLHTATGTSPTLAADGGTAFPLNWRLGTAANGWATGTYNFCFTNQTSAGSVTGQWIYVDTGYTSVNGSGWLQQRYDDILAIQSTVTGYSLELTCYELGQSIVDYSHANPTYQTYIDALMRDSRMGTTYTTFLTGLQSAGVSRACNFNDIYAFDTYGDWGALEHVFSTSSPRFDVLAAWNGSAAIPHHGGRGLGRF